MNSEFIQKRAKAGGEIGANGEFYEGDKFIATMDTTIKTAPARYVFTPEKEAAYAARKRIDAELLGRFLCCWRPVNPILEKAMNASGT